MPFRLTRSLPFMRSDRVRLSGLRPYPLPCPILLPMWRRDQTEAILQALLEHREFVMRQGRAIIATALHDIFGRDLQL